MSVSASQGFERTVLTNDWCTVLDMLTAVAVPTATVGRVESVVRIRPSSTE